MNPHANPEHHVVTVTTVTEDGWTTLDRIEFVCTAPEDGPCRIYPDCGCEVFTYDDDSPGHDAGGHLFVTGRPCWVKDWFHVEPHAEGTVYVGDNQSSHTDCGVPLVDHTGHVDIVGFELDCGPEWEWAA